MAYVKINNTELTNLAKQILVATDKLDEVEEMWGTEFADLYGDFVTSGFLNDLYEDAQNNVYDLLKGASAIALGALTGGWALAVVVGVGGLVARIIRWIFGIEGKKVKGGINWKTISKEVFENLLLSCKNLQDDNYRRISNIHSKLVCMQLAIEKIRSKVDAFQDENNKYGDTASAAGLSVRTGGSDNGIVVGIDTEIVVDGETITVDVSEAMSAFYTYAYTVTSSMIAADYLERTYGYDIDYLGLVTNANAFMADTIKSDMYTAEMIQLILPQYAPDQQAALTAASAATGLDESELQAALGDVAALGVSPLFAGLVGAGFMGKLKENNTTAPGPNNTTAPGPNNTTAPGPNNTTAPGPNNTTAPGPGPGPGPGGTGNVCSTCHQNPCICGKPGNNIDIDDPIDPDVPLDQDLTVDLGVIDEDGNVDYDKLAMEEYQFETGIEEIEKFRLGIMDDVEAKYTSGDFTSLTKQLQEYGYTTAEIATILASKSMTINAIMDGNTRQIVAAKAEAMAKADGVEDYKSSYNNNPSTSELGDTKKPLKSLHLNSDNKELVDMENKLDGLEADYKTKVDDANKLLDEAQINKQSVDDIKAKYEKEYGSDTSKWSEDAAKEYDAAIDKYNVSAEAANKAVEDANKAKETYKTTRTEFDKACEEYYKSKIISDEESGQTEGGQTVVVNPTVPGSAEGNSNSTGSTGGSATIGSDGSVSFGGSGSSNNGASVGSDGSVSFGGSAGNTSSGTAGVDTSSSGGGYMSQDSFLASLGLKSNDKDNN